MKPACALAVFNNQAFQLRVAMFEIRAGRESGRSAKGHRRRDLHGFKEQVLIHAVKRGIPPTLTVPIVSPWYAEPRHKNRSRRRAACGSLWA